MYYSVHFTANANLAYRAQGVTCVAGVRILNTPLSFAEPLPITRHIPDECHAASSRGAAILTIKQRMQLDMFLAPLQTWTVGSAAEDASWQVTSCFAPRLHRNGEIDFIAPYLAGSHALALITAHPAVTFVVRDYDTNRWLEGYAHTAIVQWPWEHTELLGYLRWRIPDAADAFSSSTKVVVFRPIYLRYYDHSSGGSFEVE
jgi:hypothetical protein